MHEVGDTGRCGVSSDEVAGTDGGDEFGQAVGHQVVLLSALLGDDRLDQHPEPLLVTLVFSLDQVDQEVRTSHDSSREYVSEAYLARCDSGRDDACG